MKFSNSKCKVLTANKRSPIETDYFLYGQALKTLNLLNI